MPAAKTRARGEFRLRPANAAFAEAIIWAFYVERKASTYGQIVDRTAEDHASLREIRMRSRQSVGKACRLIERAFADPARVKAGITLTSILDSFRELAA